MKSSWAWRARSGNLSHAGVVGGDSPLAKGSLNRGEVHPESWTGLAPGSCDSLSVDTQQARLRSGSIMPADALHGIRTSVHAFLLLELLPDRLGARANVVAESKALTARRERACNWPSSNTLLAPAAATVVSNRRNTQRELRSGGAGRVKRHTRAPAHGTLSPDLRTRRANLRIPPSTTGAER
jgi:hypothetical protein